jgi:hypothetical protein
LKDSLHEVQGRTPGSESFIHYIRNYFNLSEGDNLSRVLMVMITDQHFSCYGYRGLCGKYQRPLAANSFNRHESLNEYLFVLMKIRMIMTIKSS